MPNHSSGHSQISPAWQQSLPGQPYQQQMTSIISGEIYPSISAFYLAPLTALILTYTALYFAYHVRLKIHPHGFESPLQKRQSVAPYIFQTIQNDSPERRLHTTPLRFFQNRNRSEEPMTKVTGFQQSVRLFQSYDPVTPSILSSFLLHLSDALPSGRVLLRLSVRHPYADSPAAVQAF